MTEEKKIVEAVRVTEGREKKEKVIMGEATVVKRGIIERAVRNFVGPNGLKGVSSYVGKEIVGPAVKNIIADSFTSAINMMLYGDSVGRGTGTTNYTSYNRNTINQQPRNHNNYNRRYGQKPTGGKVNEIVMSTRNDAGAVLQDLRNDIIRYGVVSVAEYYEMVGMDTMFTDHNYGWTNLDNAVILAGNGGYTLKLPPVETI